MQGWHGVACSACAGGVDDGEPLLPWGMCVEMRLSVLSVTEDSVATQRDIAGGGDVVMAGAMSPESMNRMRVRVADNKRIVEEE